jgi:hypothetical protein
MQRRSRPLSPGIKRLRLLLPATLGCKATIVTTANDADWASLNTGRFTDAYGTTPEVRRS